MAKFKKRARWAMAQAIQLLEAQGMTRLAIAAKLALSEGTVGGIQRDYARLQAKYGSAPACGNTDQGAAGGTMDHEVYTESAERARGEEPLSWPTLVYGVDEEPDEPIYEYTGQMELVGDFVVVGDVHVPTTDWAFAERMLDVARLHLPRPRKLLIAGDLLNMDAISKFAKRVPSPSMRTELKASNRFIERMLSVFDELYAFVGNHDSRLLYILEGDISIRSFAKLVTDAYERITFSPYSDCTITSGGQRWYVPHQMGYRQTKLSVGNELAALNWTNVITTHQHHSAIGRDKGNNATIVDCGGLFRVEQMAYVQLNPSTRPRPTQGFVLLRNGCANLLTPYATMTDWDMWLNAQTARESAA